LHVAAVETSSQKSEAVTVVLQATQLLLTSLILHTITLGNQLEKHSPGDYTSVAALAQNSIKIPGKLEVDGSEKMIIPLPHKIWL
jgi:hypothetical protein